MSSGKEKLNPQKLDYIDSLLMQKMEYVFIFPAIVIDEWTATASEVHGEILLKSNEFYSIKVEYREITAKASVKLLWQKPGSSTQEVVPSTALFYTRHLASVQ